jgi:YHS domain-containing protein
MSSRTKHNGYDECSKNASVDWTPCRSVSVLNVKNTRYREVNMAKDPFCNMDVDETTAKYVSEYKGKKYFFCAPGCMVMFDRDPEKFV